MNKFDEKYKLLTEDLEQSNFRIFVKQTLNEDIAFKIFDKLADSEAFIRQGWRKLKSIFKPKDNRSFTEKMEMYFKKWDEEDNKKNEMIQNLISTVKYNKENETVKIISQFASDISKSIHINEYEDEKRIEKILNKNKRVDLIKKFLKVLFSELDNNDSAVTMRLMYLYLLVLGMLGKQQYIDFN